MPKEIERKFLVTGDRWRQGAEGVTFRQGYLCTEPERTVRVRLEGDKGRLTIKGKSVGVSRTEYEYPIPQQDAEVLLATLCRRPLIEKIRYRIEYAGYTWEIDEFQGENAGLLLAELELSSEDESFTRPPWVGQEVSEDPRYYNANLVSHPYKDW